ncbi:hypothetical protein [Mycobacterium riyadhense]|uniref:hypothetical protein n=1 Tax=Mycobacterium riyadhense TaxID=486698 RepID=UPI001956B335|nr:hypothetical protein [Mycobacterium riyadhense]
MSNPPESGSSPAQPAAHVVTGMPVKLGIRQYISVMHLWNARHMAWRCRIREDALVSAGVGGVDIQHSSFAAASIVASTSFLEALINEVWQDAHEYGMVPDRLRGLDRAVVLKLRELWTMERVEQLGILDKYQVALVVADKPKLETSHEPYQSVARIIEIRNALVHSKPETQFIDETHKLAKKLAGKFEPNPLGGYPWYPHQVLAAGCTEWAWKTCLEFAELWWKRMGFHRDLLSDFNHWPDPASDTPPVGSPG